MEVNTWQHVHCSSLRLWVGRGSWAMDPMANAHQGEGPMFGLADCLPVCMQTDTHANACHVFRLLDERRGEWGEWGGRLMLLPPHLIVWPRRRIDVREQQRSGGTRGSIVVANSRVILRLIDFKAISFKCYLACYSCP